MPERRDALLATFRNRFGRSATFLAEAPGRVNIIGEHTDYNGGHVMPAAIDRTVLVAAAPAERRVSAYSLDFDEQDEFPAVEPLALQDGGWRNYVRGVAWAIREAGHPAAGADLAFTGNVPLGAGLSSSAALETAVAGALAATSGVSIEPRQLALLAQRAENDFVGVNCGAMDQLAAVFGRQDHALLIDCRSLEVDAIPFGLDSAGLALVVVDSAVQRSLTDSAFNERRRECEKVANALGKKALRDLSPDGLEAQRDKLPALLYRRARHVVTEERRVLRAATALKGHDYATLGRILYDSHASLRDDFEVSCPELDLLVDLARGTPGVLGARLTGAGFGGCTVNLVRRDALTAFQRCVVDVYRERTGLPAEMFVVRPAAGLRVTRV